MVFGGFISDQEVKGWGGGGGGEGEEESGVDAVAEKEERYFVTPEPLITPNITSSLPAYHYR